LPELLIFLAIVVAIVYFARRKRRRGGAAAAESIDVEAELLRACHGDRRLAARLTEHELERNPKLSRVGAALMALAALRDDRR
jgi:hypothetical protein